METPPQQQGHFSPWVQPASERSATRIESGNLSTCSRFRLPRQDHLDFMIQQKSGLGCVIHIGILILYCDVVYMMNSNIIL